MNNKYLLGALKEQLPFDELVTLQDEENLLVVDARHVGIKFYDDDITLRFSYFGRGHVVTMDAIFDQLELTEENLLALNRFNEESAWFKAYGSEHAPGKVYLHVQAVAISIEDDDEALHATRFLLNQLADDDLPELLKPLTDATF